MAMAGAVWGGLIHIFVAVLATMAGPRWRPRFHQSDGPADLAHIDPFPVAS